MKIYPKTKGLKEAFKLSANPEEPAIHIKNKSKGNLQKEIDKKVKNALFEKQLDEEMEKRGRRFVFNAGERSLTAERE